MTCPHGKPLGVFCQLCKLGVAGHVQPPPECRFVGDKVPAAEAFHKGMDPRKSWTRCLNPSQPLGPLVCTCQGCNARCRGYAAEDSLRWACGVTTVPERRRDLLPKTLESLLASGFPRPHLFVDGCSHSVAAEYVVEFGLDVSCRTPRIRTFGNWVLALEELLLRDPAADRFAVFQDDLLCCKNSRPYLDMRKYPKQGYWNLYTFPCNQRRAPKTSSGGTADGFFESDQRGQGAVALVFNGEAARTLLSHRHMLDRPLDPARGHMAIDGGIVTAMNKAGWREFVHSPSLIQHTGGHSTMGNGPHDSAESFPGTAFDAMSMLQPMLTEAR